MYRASLTIPQAQDLAQRSKDLRAVAGLTQAELAKMMKVSRRTVQDIEMCTHRCYPSTYRKFLAAEERLAKKAAARGELTKADWGTE
jgi:transcriptional regulator with XRE-family HTH domain